MVFEDAMDDNDAVLADNYPTFNRLLLSVYARSPLQKKRIVKHLADKDRVFWGRAEQFSQDLNTYIEKECPGITLEDTVDAYLKMCKDMFMEQVQFERTCKYSCPDEHNANAGIYSSRNIMTYYMLGLILSYFLWPNHYAMYDFFIRETIAAGKGVRRYLEVGVGHALFLSRAIDVFKGAAFVAVDISETSIDMTRKIISYLSRNPGNIELYHMNIMSFDSKEPFDFISMGEVLEHVEDPKSLLVKVSGLLAPHGQIYITTCCNCPCIDHIYLFRNVSEIRSLFKEAGLRVKDEIILPVEGAGKPLTAHDQVALNYAAILVRENASGTLS